MTLVKAWLGANFGYIITNQGFSAGAKNRASLEGTLLQVVEFSEFEKQTVSVDDIINHTINSLACVEHVFIVRLKHWSSFIDFERSSFDGRTIAFKDIVNQGKLISFPHSERDSYKKLLETTARGFRDFPCLGRLKIIIPFAKTRQEYISEVDIDDFEDFLNVSFEELRANIELWRRFLASINKSDVQRFAQNYARSRSYEPQSV